MKPYINISEYSYYSTGWEMESSQLKKNQHFVLSADDFHHERQKDDTFLVVSPRLRFNAIIGWLTVNALHETRLSKSWCLYSPGINQTRQHIAFAVDKKPDAVSVIELLDIAAHPQPPASGDLWMGKIHRLRTRRSGQ